MEIFAVVGLACANICMFEIVLWLVSPRGPEE